MTFDDVFRVPSACAKDMLRGSSDTTGRRRGVFRRLERWMGMQQTNREGTTRVRHVLAFSHSQSTGTRCHVAVGSGTVATYVTNNNTALWSKESGITRPSHKTGIKREREPIECPRNVWTSCNARTAKVPNPG